MVPLEELHELVLAAPPDPVEVLDGDWLAGAVGHLRFPPLATRQRPGLEPPIHRARRSRRLADSAYTLRFEAAPGAD